ncbi:MULTISPECIES: hypothetical protein [unclassified Marinovum]
MKRKFTLSCLLVGSTLLLAACGGGGGGGDKGAKGINSLGQAFVNAFSLRRNDKPVDAQSVNLTLTPRKTPFNP